MPFGQRTHDLRMPDEVGRGDERALEELPDELVQQTGCSARLSAVHVLLPCDLVQCVTSL